MKELWRNKDGNIEIQCTHDEDKIIRRSKMKPQNHSSLPSSPFYENKIKVGILLCLFVMLLTIFAVEITNIMMPIINNSDNIDNYSVYDNGNEEVSQESLENSEESTTKISKTSVKNLCDRTLSPRRIRSVKSQQKHRQKKYVVAHETRFVSCSRFKPTTKDKYLASPSLDSLHTCYKYGVRSNELEKGITTNKDDELRYDLDYLYIPCEVVFNENLDELTDQLKDDYERCKWSGGLSREQQLIVENKFAVELATADQNDVPGNLENTTTSPAPLEPRAFVECSHVETELVEDYFESPSYEALHRCEKLGVTSKELEQGIGINPQPKKRRFDVGNLYMSCMDMFISELNYMTSELKDDYRRCKKVGAITKEVQDTVETKFYETLYEERGTATEKIAERPLTTTTSTPFVYESTTTEATTAAKTTMMTGTTTTTATATKRPRINRYSFANCKHIIPSVILYTVAVIVTSISLANSQLQINIDPDSFAESNVSSDDALIDTKSYVNCEHVKRLLSLDDSLFDLGIVLEKCWHHGVTLDELERGIASVPERPDVQNYNYQDFYVSCDEVFSYNVTKLTTRLLQDFLDCESANAIATDVQSSMNESFADIIDVYLNGNSSVAIDTETLVPCYNSSKDITLLCRRYGLTQYQISTGFLRYHYNDKWIVEEDIDELSLTCDTIFNAKLEDQAYDDPSRAFLSCLNSGQIIDPERRDGFEKRNAEDLMIVRDFYYPDTPIIDLRAYVSCRRLEPIRVTNVLVSSSWDALEKCRTIGVTYPELQNGTEERFDDMKRFDDQIGEFYISCENVFTEELWSFTTGLLNDYEYCKKTGRITGAANAVIKKRFNKLFQLFTTQRNVSKKKKLTSITEHLVRCTNFTGRLQDLCRQRGSTLAQELRGLGSLARTLGDLWLNTEDLDRLYVRCDDIFGNYIKFLKDVPVDQYMQCRWVDELSEKSKAFIDRKIAGFYKDTHKWNGTSLRGGANGEIASQILFD